MHMRKHVCLRIDMLYEINFFDSLFEYWRVLTNYKDLGHFLRFNIQYHLCIYVNGKEKPMYYFQKRMNIIGDKTIQKLVTYMNFNMVLHQTKTKLTQIKDSLTSKIRDKFQSNELLDDMGVVNLIYCNPLNDYNHTR